MRIQRRVKIWPAVRVLSAALAMCLMFGITPVMLANSGTVIPFDIPGAVHTRGLGINPAGQVVGSYVDSGEIMHGFLLGEGVFGLLSSGVYETIDVDGANWTRVRGINPAGEMVGDYEDAALVTHGFLLSKGNLTVLDFPGADYTIAQGINADGDVVGFYGMGGTEFGFLWSQGVFSTIHASDLGAFLTNARGINPDGDIVGLYWTGGAAFFRVFVRSHDGTYTEKVVPGAIHTSGNAINPSGEIVGDGFRPGLGHHGFLLTEGSVSLFKVPGARRTYPFGISPNGWIVGFYEEASPDPALRFNHGFLVHGKSLE